MSRAGIVGVEILKFKRRILGFRADDQLAGLFNLGKNGAILRFALLLGFGTLRGHGLFGSFSLRCRGFFLRRAARGKGNDHQNR